MKTILFNLLALANGIISYAQKLTEVKVRVTDAESKTGITDANVLIQETMMMAKTAQFGIAVFPNVPVRQVTIEVQKEGYVPRKEEINITNESANNTFAMELVKEKDNTVTIYGVVKTGSKRLSDVTVTLTIGSYQGKVITTKNGDYSFQVPKDKVTTKVKMLFAHSRFAVQEREFEVLQSQPVKELEPVVLSGAVEDVELTIDECWESREKNYYGIICFDNQMGFDIEIYEYYAGGGYSEYVFLPSTKTNWNKDAKYREFSFYFRTVPKSNTEVVLYSKFTVSVEKCWKRVVTLSKDNMRFLKDKPR